MTPPTMPHAYLWDDEDKIINFLAGLMLQGKLVLVLGAGISMPFGLPKWSDLIDDLYNDKSTIAPKGLSGEELAEYFKTTFYPHDNSGFKEKVRQLLYKNSDYSFNALLSNKTIAALGAMIMASSRGSVSQIITLNFDNLLEMYLKYYGYTVSAIATEMHWNNKTDVTIYHPHGYLPATGTGEISEHIIFDQESYLKIIGDRNNLWFQTISTILRSNICIFIGLSGDDLNLQQLMAYTKKNHICQKHNILYWGIRMTAETNTAKETIWRNRGVFTLNLRDYIEHLPNLLFRICQEAAALRI